MPEFFRFPHTPHIRWLSDAPARDEKVLSASEVKELLSREVSVEEKVDGANVGISLGDGGDLLVQNRGQFLGRPYSGQFARLTAWLGEHEAGLRDVLTDQLILFGEWCAAVHSISYDQLPDWFLLFDVFDRDAGKFWSVERRNGLAERAGLTTVPQLGYGVTTVDGLLELVASEQSRVGTGGLEGVVVRRDEGDWNVARGKLVRSNFVQAIETHWRRGPLRWNRVLPR